MKKIKKCVKLESQTLTFSQCIILETCLNTYLKCKNYFYDLLCGDKYMVKVQNAKNLRTELSRKQKQTGKSYQELFHIPQRYWVMPLFDVCSNLNSMWSNLKNFLKKRVRENDNLTKDERMYCYVILNNRELWYNVLHWIDLNDNYLNSLNLKITEQRKKSLNNYIRRITKENMFKKPHSTEIKSMWLVPEMYFYTDKFDKTKISFATIFPRKYFEIKLKGLVKFSRKGNIQIVYKRDKHVIELHKTINSKVSNKKHLNKRGVDKGYTNLLSCSNDKEYGKNIGIIFTNIAEWLNSESEKRNFYLNLCKKFEKERSELLIKRKNTSSKKEKEYLLKKIKTLTKKIENIKNNNLSKKRFQKEYNKKNEYTKQLINNSIIQMYVEGDIKILGVEDLSFVNYMSPYKGRKFNRKMSYWLKGYIDERLEYIGTRMNCKIQKVNAAYTSQFCAECGAKLTSRTGKHHEIGDCPNCGEINANTNASKNIEDRLTDKEIDLYTPYKKVKQILENRYKNKQNKHK